MGSVAHICVALICSSFASVAGAFSCMRLAHPKTRPLFDLVFAALYSSVLCLLIMLMLALFPTIFRDTRETTMLLLSVTAASLIGLWLSVGIHILGAIYDRFVLKLKQPPIKRGWPWAVLNSCITHMSLGLVLGGIAMVGLTAQMSTRDGTEI